MYVSSRDDWTDNLEAKIQTEIHKIGDEDLSLAGSGLMQSDRNPEALADYKGFQARQYDKKFTEKGDEPWRVDATNALRLYEERSVSESG